MNGEVRRNGPAVEAAPAEPAQVDPAQVDIVHHSLRRVRRRERASRILYIAFRDLLVALSVVAGYLLLERLLALPERGLLVALLALGAWALSVSVQAVLLRMSLFRAAVLADERLGLKERLSSAVYLESHPGSLLDPAWQALIRRDGERSLAGADLARQFPIRLPRIARWTLVPAVLAIVIACLPPFDILGLREERLADAALRQEVERKKDDLQKALEELRKAAEKPPDPEIQKLLEALQKPPLESAEPKKDAAPVAPPPSGEEAKREAMVAFTRMEEVLKEKLERADLAGLKEFLDRFPGGSRNPLTKGLREALKNGDFKKAQGDLDKLKKALEELSKRKDAGEQLSKEELEKLQNLAEELKRLSRDSAALSKLSKAFSGMGGSISQGQLSQSLEGLEDMAKELKDLEDLQKQLEFLEGALELAKLSQEDLANLMKCSECGKMSLQPGACKGGGT